MTTQSQPLSNLQAPYLSEIQASSKPPEVSVPPSEAIIQPASTSNLPDISTPSPKKQLCRDLRIVSLVLIGFVVIQFVLPFLIAPFVEMSLVIDPTMIGLVILTLLAAFCIRGKRLFTRDLVAVNQKIKPLSVIKIFILMSGVSCVVALIQVALDPLLESLGLSLSYALNESITEMLASPIGVIDIIILGPVVEEVLIRGAVLNRLVRYGYNFAIIVSSLLFGLLHMILIQSFGAFFVGILLAYVALRYSLKWSIVLHILNNGLSVAVTLLTIGLEANEGMLAIVDWSSWAISLVCLAASIVLLVLKRKELPRILKAGTSRVPRPFRIAFTRPLLLLLAAFLLMIGALCLVVPV